MARGTLRRLAAVGAALAAACGLSATSASATAGGGWTVSPGGAFRAAAQSDYFLTTTANVVWCTSSEITGTFASGTGASGADVGEITGAEFTDCATGAPHTAVSFTGNASAAHPWKLSVVGPDPDDAHRVVLRISGVSLSLRGLDPALPCAVDFGGPDADGDGTQDGGTATAYYDNRTGVMALDSGASQLVTTSATTCDGALFFPRQAGYWMAGRYHDGYHLDVPRTITPTP
ncbi:hypothetical protein G3I40_06680 [Streptomyces sp. SID14478]|uniref:hypothetical protein n=1 Tax=Streptomyces sp. SID14478 TaxID=2706073 RepID=UPI0013DC31F6|nr:hypothetical protein [Streptomyces sp. SID14478]NEB74919.1 hypothetical protein [Streptomyces sp. SID14478]